MNFEQQLKQQALEEDAELRARLEANQLTYTVNMGQAPSPESEAKERLRQQAAEMRLQAELMEQTAARASELGSFSNPMTPQQLDEERRRYEQEEAKILQAAEARRVHHAVKQWAVDAVKNSGYVIGNEKQVYTRMREMGLPESTQSLGIAFQDLVQQGKMTPDFSDENKFRTYQLLEDWRKQGYDIKQAYSEAELKQMPLDQLRELMDQHRDPEDIG